MVNRKLVNLALLLLLAASCDREQPELHLSYKYPSGEEFSGDFAHDMCWLTGPRETLILAEIIEKPVYHPTHYECDIEDPYRVGYTALTLEPLRTAGPDSIGGPLDIVAPWNWNTGASELNVGDEVLLSFRESQGEAISMAYVEVTSSSDAATVDTDGPLPNTWSDVEASAESTRAVHDTKCSDTWSSGPGESRRMTPDEFDQWIRETNKRSGCTNNTTEAQPQDPVPGTVEVDQ